jgi:hypothetical protein
MVRVTKRPKKETDAEKLRGKGTRKEKQKEKKTDDCDTDWDTIPAPAPPVPQTPQVQPNPCSTLGVDTQCASWRGCLNPWGGVPMSATIASLGIYAVGIMCRIGGLAQVPRGVTPGSLGCSLEFLRYGYGSGRLSSLPDTEN